jgi:hypothetical protein
MLAQITNLPPDTAADIARVFTDFGLHIAAGSIVLALLCIRAIAGYVTNFTMKNSTAETTGVLGRTIAHISGHSLPSQPIVQDTGEAVVPSNPPQASIPADKQATTIKVAVITLFVAGLALSVVSCGGGKLASGGLYAPSAYVVTISPTGVLSTNLVATSQPDLAFYAVDASFDLAESSLDAAFKIELNNRAMLFKLSPSIKHTLDQIRPVAWKVIKDYSAARTAYAALPTPTGLSNLQSSLSKISALSAAAVAATTSQLNSTNQ